MHITTTRPQFMYSYNENDHVYVQCQTAEMPLNAASLMCQDHNVLHTISKLISFNSTYVVMLVFQDHKIT